MMKILIALVLVLVFVIPVLAEDTCNLLFCNRTEKLALGMLFWEDIIVNMNVANPDECVSMERIGAGSYFFASRYLSDEYIEQYEMFEKDFEITEEMVQDCRQPDEGEGDCWIMELYETGEIEI